MLNHFLAVSTIILTVVYFTLVGATSNTKVIKDNLSPERRARLASERAKLQTPTKFSPSSCFDLKTDPLSHIDQIILQIPEQKPKKDFDIVISAFKGKDQIWLNSFTCKSDPLLKNLCISKEGSGSFTMNWTKEKSDLDIRAITFGNPISPGPVLSPKEGSTSLKMQGVAIACS